MKIVYTHENKILVENAKNLLQQSNIEVFMKNEFSSGGIGELSTIDTWPELWVLHGADYDKARRMLEQLHSKNDQEGWLCAICKEENASSFDFCWQCQSEKQ